MNGDKDVQEHNDLLDSEQLGLVNPKGTAIRMVELLPRPEGNVPHFMHRTESLDLGVVIKGGGTFFFCLFPSLSICLEETNTKKSRRDKY